MILDGLGDGHEPLGGEDDRRVDGAGESDVLHLEEEVDEDDLVDLRGVDVLAEGLQDAAEDENVVEDGQEHEEPVEDAGHLGGEQDGDGGAVADETHDADEDLEDALGPEGDGGHEGKVVVVVQAAVGIFGPIHLQNSISLEFLCEKKKNSFSFQGVDRALFFLSRGCDRH